MDQQLKTKITAQEYRDGLPKARRGTAWTMETFSVYINLLYPHVTVAPGQVWTRSDAVYQFVCEFHGPYPTYGHNVLTETQGCGCTGCSTDKNTASAGTKRSPRATKEEKELAAKLRTEGMSYDKIARQLGRGHATIQRWLKPECREMQRQAGAKWRSENRERHNATKRRYLSEFEHGRAGACANSAHRRLLKTNTPEFVFLDNEWHEVDREKTYRVFKDFLLPPSEKKEIQELYLEAQHLTEITGVVHHVDHLQPLSKNGEHRLFNLQILPGDENLSKQATFRHEDQELLINRLFN